MKYPAKLQTAILRLLTYLLPASQIDLIPDTDTDSYVKQDGNQSGKRLFCDRLVLAHLTDLWFLAITNLWRGWFASPPRLLRKASGGRCPSAPEIHHRSADVWYHRSGGSQWLIDIGGGAIITITQNALILQLLGGLRRPDHQRGLCPLHLHRQHSPRLPSPQIPARSSGSATGSSEFQAI